MSRTNGNLYAFGEFRFDLREKTLRRGEQHIPLPPKVSDVLGMLVERQGEIVAKQELMETVWADAFVEESNLTQSIYQLRRVLGTDEDGKGYIETVPRRGYRLAFPLRYVEKEPQPSRAEEIETVAPDAQETDSTPLINPEPHPVKPNKSTLPRFPLPATWLWLIAPVTLILLTGFISTYFYSSKPPPPAAPVANVGFQKLTFSGDIAFPIIAPDGKAFAVVRADGIYLQDIATGNNFRLEIPDHKVFGNLQFSIDGESVYFRNEDSYDAGSGLFQVSRYGGAARKIAEDVWSTPGFSPDGRQMAFIRFYPKQSEWALLVKNLVTGEESKLVSRIAPYTLYRRGFPAWSLDGSKIAAVEQTPNQKNVSRLIIINTETGAVETLRTSRFVQIEQMAWLSDNTGLIVAGREQNRFFQLWKMAYPGGEPQRITNDIFSNRNPSLSADGRYLLVQQQTTYSNLWTANVGHLDNQKQITFGNLNRDCLTAGSFWTKDGESVIYSSRIMGNVDLWSVRAADGVRRQLTENAGNNNESPALSADEKHIYFESTRTGTRHVWRIDINGENPAQMTFGEKEVEFYPAASPDGKWLYFLQKGAAGNAIWRKSLTDEKLERITEAGRFAPNSFVALSPDGKFLAFNNFLEKGRENSGGKNIQVVVVAVDNSVAPRFFNLSANMAKVVWEPEGKALDFIENTPASAKLWRQYLDDRTEPKLILQIPQTRMFDFAWSADGKTLALARGQSANDAILLTGF